MKAGSDVASIGRNLGIAIDRLQCRVTELSAAAASEPN